MVLSTNIVAYYKCENVNDSVASYNLTNVASVTFTAGKIDNCANISSRGSSAKGLHITNNLGITGGNITISCWYLANSNPTGAIYSGDYLVSQTCGSTQYVQYDVEYYLNAGTPTLHFFRQRGGVANDSYVYATTLTTGTWYHIAITYDGATVQGYLNGAAVGAGVASTGNGSSGIDNQFIIGGTTDGAGSFNWKPDGKLDEVGIWSRALSGSEIAELYNSGSGLQYPFTSTAVRSSLFFGGGL